MVGCATDTRTRRQASAVDCVRGRLSVLVSRVCVCHQPIPHDARECIVGLRSAAVTPIAPPSVVCRVSDVGARLRLVWAASAEYDSGQRSSPPPALQLQPVASYATERHTAGTT